MRRRLDLAAALVVSPPVMFMDEPTTGLDPRNRQALWEVIQELVAGGTTLLLTTQYLEEADHLAHEICVIDHGRVIARGTSDQLKARTGGERVEVVVHTPGQIPTGREVLARFGQAAATVTVEEHTRRLTVPVTGGARLLAEVIRELDARGVEIDDIRAAPPHPRRRVHLPHRPRGRGRRRRRQRGRRRHGGRRRHRGAAAASDAAARTDGGERKETVR